MEGARLIVSARGRPQEKHPEWSYWMVDIMGYTDESRELKPISELSTEDFAELFETAIRTEEFSLFGTFQGLPNTNRVRLMDPLLPEHRAITVEILEGVFKSMFI